MLSPLQRAAFIDSKIVSMVSSACFCVSWRLATRMAIRSLFSMRALREVRRSKTFDGWERYMTGPAAGKRREARLSGRLAHTLSYTSRDGFRHGSRLGSRGFEPAEEGLQGLVQDGLCGVLSSLERMRDDLGDLVGFLRWKSQGRPRCCADLPQGDPGGVPGQQPSPLPRLHRQATRGQRDEALAREPGRDAKLPDQRLHPDGAAPLTVELHERHDEAGHEGFPGRRGLDRGWRFGPARRIQRGAQPASQQRDVT